MYTTIHPSERRKLCVQHRRRARGLKEFFALKDKEFFHQRRENRSQETPIKSENSGKSEKLDNFSRITAVESVSIFFSPLSASIFLRDDFFTFQSIPRYSNAHIPRAELPNSRHQTRRPRALRGASPVNGSKNQYFFFTIIRLHMHSEIRMYNSKPEFEKLWKS